MLSGFISCTGAAFMGSPLDGTPGTCVTFVGGAQDWPRNWVVEGACICIHGLGYCGGPTSNKPHGWGCIQLYCIQPSGGCHLPLS